MFRNVPLHLQVGLRLGYHLGLLDGLLVLLEFLVERVYHLDDLSGVASETKPLVVSLLLLLLDPVLEQLDGRLVNLDLIGTNLQSLANYIFIGLILLNDPSQTGVGSRYLLDGITVISLDSV